jgi:hypothetical protein
MVASSVYQLAAILILLVKILTWVLRIISQALHSFEMDLVGSCYGNLAIQASFNLESWLNAVY